MEQIFQTIKHLKRKLEERHEKVHLSPLLENSFLRMSRIFIYYAIYIHAFFLMLLHAPILTFDHLD